VADVLIVPEDDCLNRRRYERLNAKC